MLHLEVVHTLLAQTTDLALQLLRQDLSGLQFLAVLEGQPVRATGLQAPNANKSWNKPLNTCLALHAGHRLPALVPPSALLKNKYGIRTAQTSFCLFQMRLRLAIAET